MPYYPDLPPTGTVSLTAEERLELERLRELERDRARTHRARVAACERRFPAEAHSQ